MSKRSVEVVVLSDVHLGTYACRAKELLQYLQSISPRILILNGDIIDGWQFSKHYFPAPHIAVIQEILHLLSTGTRVIYITGNHDEALRRYSDMQMGSFQLADKVVIEINGKRTWVFHGDVFDHTTSNQAKFWTKLGSNGYAILLGFNRFTNKMMKFFGGEPLSFSKNIMHQFHKRVVKVDAFENLVAGIAAEKKYDCVICGHIHQPQKRVIETEGQAVLYLNSGDWVEHMTTLEYYDYEWHLYNHTEVPATKPAVNTEKPVPQVMTNEIALHIHSMNMPGKAI